MKSRDTTWCARAIVLLRHHLTNHPSPVLCKHQYIHIHQYIYIYIYINLIEISIRLRCEHLWSAFGVTPERDSALRASRDSALRASDSIRNYLRSRFRAFLRVLLRENYIDCYYYEYLVFNPRYHLFGEWTYSFNGIHNINHLFSRQF